jgi:uncharacterized membrane protein YjgN (DUF898 family)|tara:strand:- start:82 stop:519 length:438 start_codon:yes stop_codon:yes gene_type:complete
MGASKLMRFLIFSILFLLTNSLNYAQAKTDYRCGVRLIFDSDGSGSVANYVLSLQVKNTTGRVINGVSVIYKDQENNVIGNTFLNCSINAQDVKPGSYGECIRTLQRVDGAYINSFGVEKWTEIVNTQLKSLNSIQYCQTLGFSY